MATIVDRTLPRIVCLDCMRDVKVTPIDWKMDFATDTRCWIVAECHERRIARIDGHMIESVGHAGRPMLWTELRFIAFDEEMVQQWESDATALMDRVRIVTEHFKAGGK